MEPLGYVAAFRIVLLCYRRCITIFCINIGRVEGRRASSRERVPVEEEKMVTASCASNEIAERSKFGMRISFYVRILWSTLSILVSTSCTYSLFKPQWFINPSTDLCLGVVSFCYDDRKFYSPSKNVKYGEIFDMNTNARSRLALFEKQRQAVKSTSNLHAPPYKKEKIRVCRYYGVTRFRLGHLPSDAWQVACIIFGIGCLLGCFSAFLSLVTIALKSTLWNGRMACYTAFLQSLAALLLSTGLLILPAGMNSKLAHYICKSSSAYNMEKCTLGWPYVLSAVSTALSFFCPFLSRHINLEETPPTKEAV